jgi:hypothetical protein
MISAMRSCVKRGAKTAQKGHKKAAGVTGGFAAGTENRRCSPAPAPSDLAARVTGAVIVVVPSGAGRGWWRRAAARKHIAGALKRALSRADCSANDCTDRTAGLSAPGGPCRFTGHRAGHRIPISLWLYRLADAITIRVARHTGILRHRRARRTRRQNRGDRKNLEPRWHRCPRKHQQERQCTATEMSTA